MRPGSMQSTIIRSSALPLLRGLAAVATLAEPGGRLGSALSQLNRADSMAASTMTGRMGVGMTGTPLRKTIRLVDPSIVRFAALALLLALTACSTPAQRFDALAEQVGLRAVEVDGDGFQHRAYAGPGNGDVLHVYLGGDGSPWLRAGRVALDPTPRRPVLPALMAQDPAASVYLGRPCYHGHAGDQGCSAWLWTHGRYAGTVVDSLAAAVTRLIDEGGYDRVVFIGFSGGGTLAMLLAAAVPETLAVITLAGNLDVAAWGRHHGYSPLAGSLDPAQRPALPAHIAQLHVLATADTVVPPRTQAALLSRLSGCRFGEDGELLGCAAEAPGPVQVWANAGADHHCCWGQPWPRVLKWLRQHDPVRAAPGRPAESF